jgi:porin
VDPNDALVNTLGLFATWKIYRAENGKDFAGLGFQAETRGNHIGEFTELRNDLGSLWSPNDSTSDDYTKINQLWWAEKFAEGRLAFQIGKIDPGSIVNANRFAGSGNTQFFSQPFATNPARSFAQNGLGFQARAEPVDWLYLHFLMSDGDAISNHSPFTTIRGNWLYAGEVGLKPVVPNLGQGIYRFMLYQRENEAANEVGWAISADQNLSEEYGVFLRYGGNDAGINSIEHLVSVGVSWLQPFGRINDQAGIAASYTHPSSPDLRDEYSTEVYYRLQLSEGIEVSASTQLIFDPSAGDQDEVAVFGLRARLLY